MSSSFQEFSLVCLYHMAREQLLFDGYPASDYAMDRLPNASMDTIPNSNQTEYHLMILHNLYSTKQWTEYLMCEWTLYQTVDLRTFRHLDNYKF